MLVKIYGDSIFPWMSCLRSRFAVAAPQVLTNFEGALNKARNSCREPIEWSYRDLGCYFQTSRTKRALKLLNRNVADIMDVCAIFMDAHNCIYHNQCSEFFDCAPPTLQHWTSQGPR